MSVDIVTIMQNQQIIREIKNSSDLFIKNLIMEKDYSPIEAWAEYFEMLNKELNDEIAKTFINI